MTCPFSKINSDLSKNQTKYDGFKELKLETEKHDHENILKSLRIDKNSNKKENFLNLSEILLESGSPITSPTVSLFMPSLGFVLTSSTALLMAISILITNKFISKYKVRCTKLID